MSQTIRQQRTLAEPGVLKRRIDWRRVRHDVIYALGLFAIGVCAAVAVWWLAQLIITLMPG